MSRVIRRLAAVAVLAAALAVLNVSAQPECAIDADCVFGQCCHPTTCVPHGAAPDCAATACTMMCNFSTLDCGGSCGCVNGRCIGRRAEPSLPYPTSPTIDPSRQTCSADGDCVSSACCDVPSCVNQAYAPNCAAVACADVVPAFECGCSSGMCRVRKITSPGETAPAPTIPQEQRNCSADEQCRPSTCCETTDCVNAAFAPDCTAVLCFAPPRFNRTCGCGSDGCVLRDYGEFTPAPLPTPDPQQQVCGADSDCVPSRCCDVSSCVNTSYAPDCSAVLCPAVYIDAFCGCNSGMKRCEVRSHSSTTSSPAQGREALVPLEQQQNDGSTSAAPDAASLATTAMLAAVMVAYVFWL